MSAIVPEFKVLSNQYKNFARKDLKYGFIKDWTCDVFSKLNNVLVSF
jgi:hypothetical protein